jgi:peroxiredoxin
MTPLPPGTKAPDFSLPTTPDQKVALSDFAGKNLVLVFYPADWSPVCGDQLAVYNEILPMVKKKNAEVIGISVDGVWCHVAYSKERNFRFPLLADFEPKGEVARRYGVYRLNEGTSERALFVINDKGVVHWSYVSPIGVNPGADGILDALDSLSETQRSPHDQSASKTTRPGL